MPDTILSMNQTQESLLEVHFLESEEKQEVLQSICFVSASMLGILHTLYHPNPTIKPGIDLLQTMKLNSRKVKASGKFGSESTSFLDAILPGTSILFMVCLFLPEQN